MGHLGARFVDVHLACLIGALFAAHLNLNDEYLPYKYVIGQVIMDVSVTRGLRKEVLIILLEKSANTDCGKQTELYPRSVSLFRHGINRRGA